MNHGCKGARELPSVCATMTGIPAPEFLAAHTDASFRERHDELNQSAMEHMLAELNQPGPTKDIESPVTSAGSRV